MCEHTICLFIYFIMSGYLSSFNVFVVISSNIMHTLYISFRMYFSCAILARVAGSLGIITFTFSRYHQLPKAPVRYQRFLSLEINECSVYILANT